MSESYTYNKVSNSSSKRKRQTALAVSALDELSDAEIIIRFRSLGHQIGPIGPSTRQVYLRKLARLLECGDHQANILKQPGEDPNAPIHTRNPSKRNPVLDADEEQPVASIKSSTATRRRPLRSADGFDTSSASTSYVAQEEAKKTSKKAVKPTKGLNSQTIEPTKRWIPVWVQIVFTLVLLIFAYMVIQTMESNPAQLTLPKEN